MSKVILLSTLFSALNFLSSEVNAANLPTKINCEGAGWAVDSKYHVYQHLNWDRVQPVVLNPSYPIAGEDPYNPNPVKSESKIKIGDCIDAYVEVDLQSNVKISIWQAGGNESQFLGSSEGFKYSNIYIPNIKSPVYDSTFVGPKNHCSIQLTCKFD